MDPATIGISIIAVIAGGTALGFYAMWRHSEELQRGFRMDAQRYKLDRDNWFDQAKFDQDQRLQAEAERDALQAEADERHQKLSTAGKKGRQIQLEKRRAA